jgi:hypothetical protein
MCSPAAPFWDRASRGNNLDGAVGSFQFTVSGAVTLPTSPVTLSRITIRTAYCPEFRLSAKNGCGECQLPARVSAAPALSKSGKGRHKQARKQEGETAGRHALLEL